MKARVLGLSAVMVLAAAAAGTGLVFLFFIETATVKIAIRGSQIETTAVVHGATTGGDFKTQRIQVALSQSAQGSATGVATTPASYATGYVVFHNTCYAQSCLPPPAQPGYEVCRVNPAGGAWCYVLQSAVTCFCGERVPVRARGPGSTFNAPAHTVNYVTWMSTYITVDNPQPITGGSDAWSSPVVRQSDIDAVAASLSSQLTADLQSDLQQQAQDLHSIPDGAPTLTVSSDLSAGAHSGTFRVTVSGTLGATTFVDADAQAVIAKALSGDVPAGYRLTGPPLITDYQIQNSSAQGDVTVSGKAIGLLVPKASTDSLRKALRGLDVGAARRVVESVAPGSAVEIRLASGKSASAGGSGKFDDPEPASAGGSGFQTGNCGGP